MRTSQERVLVSRRIHWAVFVLPLIGVAIITIAALVPFILVSSVFQSFARTAGVKGPHWSVLALPFSLLVLPELGFLWLAWEAAAKTEYVLTNCRLRFRSGLLCRSAGELPLEKIEAVFIREGLLGRILGYGNVIVTGLGGTAFPLHFVPEAQSFHQRLQEAVEAVRAGKSLGGKPAFREARREVERPEVQDDSRYMPKV